MDNCESFISGNNVYPVWTDQLGELSPSPQGTNQTNRMATRSHVEEKESEYAYSALNQADSSLNQALWGPESEHWQQAIEKELNGLEERKVFNNEPDG